MRILATFPGKIGDLIYTLPAISKLQIHFGCRIDYQISAYCKPALKLLKTQSYIGDVIIDESYRIMHTKYGCQPYKMNEPEGYDHIFHLGFRPSLFGGSILDGSYHLIEVNFVTLERIYKLSLDFNLEDQFLFIEEHKKENYIVFNCGSFIQDQALLQRSYLVGKWNVIFEELSHDEVVILCTQEERDFFSTYFNKECIITDDLLEAALVIDNAKFFLGCQSACYAIAEGLKVPRLILHIYKNAYPVGENGFSLTLRDNISETLNKIKQFIK